MKAGCSNPVLYFDELDKVSASPRGDEIINKLIHMTDSSQNSLFSDKFFCDIDLDLSRCLIIFSYNNAELVNPILKDRMIQINTHGYNAKDKQRIAVDYLLPVLLSEFNMDCNDVVFSNAMIDYIVQYIDEEEGVRNLKRAMHEIVSSINLARLLDADAVLLPMHVTHTHVHDYIKTSVRHANESHRYPMHMYT
jgi:ATP-dependent Lon protease